MASPELSNLLKLLKQFERQSEKIEEEDPLFQEIVAYAESALITRNGACNWEAHEYLSEHGYEVFCAERDSFGWLIGGIQTTKGPIYYG